MSRARNIADLLDSNGDVKAAALDNDPTSLSDLGVTATATELNYVDGVTSAIQTQIDGKQASGSYATAAQGTKADSALQSSDIGTSVQAYSSVLAGTTASFTTADETKLDGVETGADVTDATNVNAAGAVMNSDTTTASMSFVVDEDTMTSNSATKVPTQQSVKAYVDSQVAGVVDSAPAALDTLNELAAALGDDANFATTTATSLGEKLVKASNLSDLTSASTARTNLGLGGLATLSTVNASTITDNSVGAAELNVSGNGTTSQFLRSDGDGTFTWATPTDTNTTYSAGAGLDLSGTTFSVEYDLRGDAWFIGRDTNDYYTVNTTVHDWYLDGNLDMRLENDGDLHVDGDVIAYSTTTSDERLKTDIVTITDALKKVNSLRGVEFTYKADGKRSAGLIAQEVEKILPQAVRDKELPVKMGEEDTTEYKVLEYNQTIGLLVEAIKELSAKVEELENR